VVLEYKGEGFMIAWQGARPDEPLIVMAADANEALDILHSLGDASHHERDCLAPLACDQVEEAG
jgi:hypothetical protein